MKMLPHILFRSGKNVSQSPSFTPPPPLFRSSGGMTLCLHDRLCVCVSAFWHTLFYILVYTFFIGLYLFNTATDQVHFWHACTLGPGLYSPNVFGDAALINYANLCKSVSPSTFWYTLFYILVYTFLSVYIFLIQQLIGFIFGMHVP